MEPNGTSRSETIGGNKVLQSECTSVRLPSTVGWGFSADVNSNNRTRRHAPRSKMLSRGVARARTARGQQDLSAALELEAEWKGFLSAIAARARLRLYMCMAGDFARRNPEWARVLYLEIWPSVLIGGSPLRSCIDDYVHIILFLIRQGERLGEWESGPDPYETAAILNGSVNQVIITSLLYRQPRNLTKATESIVDRTMTLLKPPSVG